MTTLSKQIQPVERCEYRVLSVIQPWASLLVHGLKRIETRSWPTPFRGPLLIHAGAQWRRSVEEAICAKEYFSEALEQLGFRPHFSARFDFTGNAPALKSVRELPRGAVVGQVTLETCQPSHTFFESPISNYISDRELAFGDLGPERYGWVCSNAIAFAEPIPMRGELGVFYLDKQYQQAVTEQIARATSQGR